MKGIPVSERPAVLFDLDGTLTDPCIGITDSVAYALGKFGIAVDDPHRTLTPFIGPPLLESFEKFYGFTPDEARRAFGYYREYFSPKGIFENTVYPGVPEMLEALRAAGKRLCVATSKPEAYARRILEHFSLETCFDAVCGATMDETRVRKADIIAYALRTMGVPPDSAVMVGDRLHDAEGAHACGLPVVGAAYGYGSREELTEAGVDAMADTPSDILRILLDGRAQAHIQ